MRRLQVLESMNYAEKRGWEYVIHWTFAGQYKFMLRDPNQDAELRKHLKEWEED